MTAGEHSDIPARSGGAPATVAPARDAAQPAAKPAAVEAGRIQEILVTVQEVVYEWDLASDALKWSSNAASVLHVDNQDCISTGKKLASYLDRENRETPHSVVACSQDEDDGGGVAFQLQYALLPGGKWKRDCLWIEDTGRWFAGANGRPARACGVLRVINERHEREQRMAYLSRYDELTGQMNRAALVAALEETLANVARYQTSAAFIIAAVDDLAMINTAFGFDVADDVIREIGSRLRERMRGGDSIGRFSGNKFGMVLVNCSDKEMQTAADRLRACIREMPVQTSAGPVAVTISLGAVQLPRYSQNAQKAMLLAQDALDQAKMRHRDSFAAYVPTRGVETARRNNIKIADNIISALNEGRVMLAFQPVVSVRTGEASFHESLLRMTDAQGNVISAEKFIPAAEKLGLARLLDHRVLELAIQKLKERHDVTLAINISATTASDEVWRNHLQAQIAAFPDIAPRLIIEITETVAIHDLEESRRFIRVVKDLGCRVAIDDFGAGYTSFKNLKILDVDMVKIDGAFVENLSADPDNQVFVRTLIELTKNFKMETVAEWVMSEDDAALLVKWGADYLQGHLVGRAMRDIPLPNGDAAAGGAE